MPGRVNLVFANDWSVKHVLFFYLANINLRFVTRSHEILVPANIAATEVYKDVCRAWWKFLVKNTILIQSVLLLDEEPINTRILHQLGRDLRELNALEETICNGYNIMSNMMQYNNQRNGSQ